MNQSNPPTPNHTDIILFQSLLCKYKKVYYHSYNFLISFHTIYVEDTFIVPIYVKPFLADVYWSLILTVPFNAPYDTDLQLVFQYILSHYPFPKPLPISYNHFHDPRKAPSPLYRDYYRSIYNSN